MKKRMIGTLFAVLLAAAMVVGCSGGTDGKDSKTEKKSDSSSGKDKITVGVTMKDNSDEFVKRIANAIEAEGKKEDVKILMNDAQGDVNKQVSDVENMIAQGVDVIILNAQDMEGSSPCVTQAKEAGIPLIVCNTDVSNTDYTGFVGCTDQESGEMLAKWFMDNLPKGSNVCIIEGPMGQAGQVGRMEGFKSAGMLDYFNVLATQTANWKRDEAMTLAEDWVTTYGDKLNAIICENDDMAMGALSACKAAGRDDIVIGGVDGIDDALEAVKNGETGVSIVQDAEGQGTTAVEMAVKAAKGEEIPYDTRIPFKECTSDNADEFLK